MTQQQFIISRKTNILELGRTLGNISEACHKLGVSRTHYYDIRKSIEEEGFKGPSGGVSEGSPHRQQGAP